MRFYILALLIVFLISFGISVLAPGNRIRSESLHGNSPFVSIVKSFVYASIRIGIFTKLPQVIMLVFMFPILYKLSFNCNWNFKYPFAVLFLSLCIFSAQLTPAVYAMNSIGAGRQINIYYYFYYIMMIFDTFYVCGWISKRVKADNISSLVTTKNAVCVLLVMAFVSLSSLTGETSFKNLTSYETAISVCNGTIYEYDREYKAIRSTLVETSGDCEIPDIETRVSYLQDLGIDYDKDFWVNKLMAKFFGCNSITKKQ